MFNLFCVTNGKKEPILGVHIDSENNDFDKILQRKYERNISCGETRKQNEYHGIYLFI